MKILEFKVFTFDELSDKAKERAREWYRGAGLDYEWWDSTYDDAAQIGLRITSFGLDRNRFATGEFTKDAQTVCDLILANHGVSCETHKTALKFKNDFNDLKSPSEDYDDKFGELKEEFEKSLLEDYSIILQKEYEYLYSNESVDENIKANEYTFLESGKRFG